jgi:hypothetical protein
MNDHVNAAGADGFDPNEHVRILADLVDSIAAALTGVCSDGKTQSYLHGAAMLQRGRSVVGLLACEVPYPPRVLSHPATGPLVPGADRQVAICVDYREIPFLAEDLRVWARTRWGQRLGLRSMFERMTANVGVPQTQEFRFDPTGTSFGHDLAILKQAVVDFVAPRLGVSSARLLEAVEQIEQHKRVHGERLRAFDAAREQARLELQAALR